MSFEDFIKTLGLLIKQAREARLMTLYVLSTETNIVADQIQKIESAKHGGIEIFTYLKLLAGLKITLTFTKNENINQKLIPIPDNILNFIHTLFLDLTRDYDNQFLNSNEKLLIKKIGQLLFQKRTNLKLSQKELAKKANISNTTIVRLEQGKYNFRLSTLYKITSALNNK